MASIDALPHYHHCAALVVGLFQVAAGVGLVALQVPIFTQGVHVLRDVALGWWTGLVFFKTGICAVVSCRMKSKFVVAVVMGISILSVLFCGVGLLVAGLSYIIATVPTGNSQLGNVTYSHKFISDVTISQVSLLFLEGFLAIVAIVLVCQALVCGRSQDAPQVHILTAACAPTGTSGY